MSNVERLSKEVLELANSNENLRRIEVSKRLASCKTVSPVPFNSWNLEVGFPFAALYWGEKLGHPIDMDRTANLTGEIPADDARELIEFQLSQKIERFRNVPEEIPLSMNLHTNLGLCWISKTGPFGDRYIYDTDSGAFVPEEVVKTIEDLDRLEAPHFQYDQDLHERRIAVFREIVGTDFNIVDDGLPPVPGAPFSTVNNLAGVTKILESFLLEPEFVHGIMDFISRAMVTYLREMKKALGTPVFMTFGCDEVSCNMFSPETYLEFIHPYERLVAEECDFIYYHSCGNLSPLFETIGTLPNLSRVHVSPWSDMQTAVRTLGGRFVLEKHLHPSVDLDSLSESEMRAYVREVTDIGTDFPLEMVVPTNTPGGREYRRIFYEETGVQDGLLA